MKQSQAMATMYKIPLHLFIPVIFHLFIGFLLLYLVCKCLIVLFIIIFPTSTPDNATQLNLFPAIFLTFMWRVH